MNIQKYIESYYKGSRELSLDSMKFFMEKYNRFEKNMKFIHVAGTNGKGSVTEIISNILKTQGYKVGKFLSPHLISINERISINGNYITDDEIKAFINELTPCVEEFNKKGIKKVSFFELITMIALLYFYRNNVDFVILETGVGGLNDATNIITCPLVSIITSVGFDHMQLLGNSIEEITSVKAGIIKENSNTVISDQSKEINEIFINKCKEKNNDLCIVKSEDIKNYTFDSNYQYFDYKDNKGLITNLKGRVQVNNICICIETLNILRRLGFMISIENVKKSIKNVIHKGRMEILSKKPLIIFDGAHNEPAFKNMQGMVDNYYKGKEIVYIVSILKRKDYESMLKCLCKDKNAILIVTSGNDEIRYTSKEELYDIAIKYKDKSKVLKLELKDAINKTYEMKDKIFFVIGSLYVYGTVLNLLKK